MNLNTNSDTMKPQIELRCKVDSSMLGLLRDFVCGVARHLGFAENQVAEIEISVDEACANAIEHAYDLAVDDAHYVLVELYHSGNELTIRISDRGLGSANPEQHVLKLEDYLDISREKYRGLGLLLMQKFMDRVDVRSQPGMGTTVEMTKIRR